MTGEQYESKMKLHVNEVNTMTKVGVRRLAFAYFCLSALRK